MDEATSALDSEVEAMIQRQLTNMMQGKTVIAIAHRLSTIAEMDRLIIMDQGEIIEDGSHEDLIQKRMVFTQGFGPVNPVVLLGPIRIKKF